MKLSADVQDMLNGVVGVVEASSYETLCLWNEYHEQRKESWEGDNRGFLLTIGQLGGRPVVLSIIVKTIKGHKILFIDPTSQVVDYEMIDKWLETHLPKTAFRPDANYVNKVDAMNFHNVFPGN